MIIDWGKYLDSVVENILNYERGKQVNTESDSVITYFRK
jgi:hypothetical protein